jgi:hypothetical protein
MRLRLFAALLLAPLALAGCDDDPIGAGGAALVGSWATEEIQLDATAPNGSTVVRYRENRSYELDGTFVHTAAIIDVTTGRSWVVLARKGTWRASEDELREVTREAFYAIDQTQAPEVPVLVPVDPQVSRASYHIEGGTLLIYPVCPPNAQCVPPRPLYRAPTVF